MKIWFISDTHTKHKELSIPKVDMVMFCGDESNDKYSARNFHEAIDFLKWYSDLPIQHKVFVPGNHSMAIAEGMIEPYHFPKIHFLIHQFREINNLKIFGSPFTPLYGDGWSYMFERNRMYSIWRSLRKCDILLTHGPPKGYLDLTDDLRTGTIVSAGCAALAARVRELEPKIHAFGHIHASKEFPNNGILDTGVTKYINCSCYNHKENSMRNGFVVEI